MMTRRQFVGGVAATSLAAALRGAEKKDGWIIGCYTRPWARYEYRVALDSIAEAGYKYAGIMTAKTGNLVVPDTPGEKVSALADDVKARGLSVASMWGGNFLAKGGLDDGIARLKRLIDHSALLHCPELLLGGVTRQEQVSDYYKAVAECCDYGASKGVRMSVKPHGGQNSTGAQCRSLIERVGNKNFQLWYDPGNIFYYSEGKIDPVDDAAGVDGIVCGMCVKDWLPPKNVDVTPGTGRVNFPKVFERLARGGFTHGPLIVECVSPGDLAHTTAEAKKAREFLEGVLRA